jgi:hypothetical protein
MVGTAVGASPGPPPRMGSVWHDSCPAGLSGMTRRGLLPVFDPPRADARRSHRRTEEPRNYGSDVASSLPASTGATIG